MVAPGAKKPSSSRLDAELRARHEALALVEEHFRDFDVVWAKVHGFPWWPGVLFHSWDVVRRAGIRTDPKIVAELVVPPPEKVAEVDAATGQETGAFRLRRHCLVMFLDKFNFSVVEIDTSNVASFTAHYQLYERAVMGSKNSKKKTEFRRALVKAAELLHLGNEFEEDDLVMLEEPSPAEKKQRMEEVMGADLEDSASLEDAWDDPENEDDAVFELSSDVADKKPMRKSEKARKGKEAKDAKDDAEQDYEFVILTPAKQQQKAPAKDSTSRVRKASRKEGQYAAHIISPSPSPIDLTNTTPEREKKKSYKDTSNGTVKPPKPRIKKAREDAARKSKKSVRDRILILEDDDDLPTQSDKPGGDSGLVREEAADIAKDADPSDLVLTPLSAIWTTISGEQGAEVGAHTQLEYKQDFVWDDTVFTDDLSIAEKEKAEIERKQFEDAAAHAGVGRERSLGKRQSRSVQQSQIRQNLMTGNLDPHTMVQCAAYRTKDYVEDPNSRSRGGPILDPPFQVVVHPDAVFVADLHSHLATCEIIGFLGGKWDGASKTLYIQAAFPCRSLVIDGDDGSTDVEMDPGSEIELRGIIEDAQLEVVGWYHSHPAFAPDPSVRDIENQTSYQQLFRRPGTNKEASGEKKPSEPFVGLIVGTYDTRRNTPVSLFRYFHTRGEKVSGGARREIYMPYEFIPGRRHFRSVLQDEERERTRLFPMYPSVLQLFSLKLTSTQEHLPMGIKAATARRTTSKSSPVRAKPQGSVRKRKPSSDNGGDKPVEKANAKSRRSMRSVAASHIDLTGEDETQNLELADNGSVKGTRESTTNEDLAETTQAKAITSSSHDKDVVKGLASSKGAIEGSSSEATVASPVEGSGFGSVDRQIAEVVADAVISTEVANNGAGMRTAKDGMSPSASCGFTRKRDRKPRKTVKNSYRSNSPASDGPLADRSPSFANPPAQTLYEAFHAQGPRFRNGGAHQGNAQPSNSTGHPKPDNPLVVDDMEYIAIVDGYVGMDVTNYAGNDGGEKQPPAHTLYEAFHAQEPRFRNGGDHQGSAQPSNCPGHRKPVNPLVVDDMEYIAIVDGSADMDATSYADNDGGEQKRSSGPSNARSDVPATATPDTASKLLATQAEVKRNKLVVAQSEVKRDKTTGEPKYLAALRTKYGTGVGGCTEQVITLVDYYRDFERRTDLNEIWKSRITKLEKIESSLSEYVQFLNIPAALRRDFIVNLISYLRESWAANDRRR